MSITANSHASQLSQPGRQHIGHLHVYMGLDTRLYADEQVGRPDGYATLEEAVADLHVATSDEAGRPAAVVYEEGGRFKARALEQQGVGGGAAPFHFEQYDYHDGVVVDAPARAIVDGYQVVRLGEPGVRVDEPQNLPLRSGEKPIIWHKDAKQSWYIDAKRGLSPAEGYSSLADAVEAMRELTRDGGPAGSAVIYRDGPVFHARELMKYDGPSKTFRDREQFYQPWNPGSDAVGRIEFTEPFLEAVVDGDVVDYGR